MVRSVKQHSKCDFYLGRGNLVVFLMIDQPNGPLPKKIIIKTLWDAP
jgi:hypothetical protein